MSDWLYRIPLGDILFGSQLTMLDIFFPLRDKHMFFGVDIQQCHLFPAVSHSSKCFSECPEVLTRDGQISDSFVYALIDSLIDNLNQFHLIKPIKVRFFPLFWN